MKKIIFFVLIISTLFSVSCQDETKGEVNVISPQEMESLLKTEDVQVVDVRTPSEYTKSHIEFAQNINSKSPTFNDDIKQLDKDKPVLLYCKEGIRSAKCAKKMLNAGFKKIYDLEGGFSKWRHQGLKVETKQ